MSDAVQALIEILEKVIATLELLAPKELHASLTAAAERRQKALAEASLEGEAGS